MGEYKKVILALFFCYQFIATHAVFGGALSIEAARELLANPYCTSLIFTPDMYQNGTGVSRGSACQAASAGLSAVKAIDDSVAQDISLAKQAESVAQEILTVQNLVIQTQELIKDIEEHPLQVIVPDVNQIIKNQKRIARLAHDIDKGSSAMGENLIRDLHSPDTIGLGQGSKFQLWSEARKRAVDESFSTVKDFITALEGEDKSVSGIIKNLNGAKGQRANAQALSSAAGMQLTFLGKIEETLLKLLSLNAAESGSKLQGDADAAKAAEERAKGRNSKPSDDIADKADIVVSNHPSFFGLRSVK